MEQALAVVRVFVNRERGSGLRSTIERDLKVAINFLSLVEALVSVGGDEHHTIVEFVPRR